MAEKKRKRERERQRLCRSCWEGGPLAALCQPRHAQRCFNMMCESDSIVIF